MPDPVTDHETGTYVAGSEIRSTHDALAHTGASTPRPGRGEITPVPVGIPAAAPVEVGAAALAASFAVEVMAVAVKHGYRREEFERADALLREQREIIHRHGWRMRMDLGGPNEWIVEAAP
jgi:hypothetical protein